MKIIENLEKDIKENKLSSLYLLYGEERYLIDTIVNKIKKSFGELVNGINYILIDETNFSQLISDVETPAFGFEKKLIIAKNTGLFKREGKRKNVVLSEMKDKLNKYINENIDIINENVILIFIEEEINKDKLFKTIDEKGITCNFEYLKPIQLEKRIKAICNAYKVDIDVQTIKYFIECTGTNMQEVINEIRKLIEYAGPNGKIEKQAIDKLTIKPIQAIIFDLTDNLGKKDIAKALEVLKNLIYSKEPVQKILITLYNHFKKLYIVKLAEKYGKNIQISLKLKPNQAFLTTKYKAQARFFNENELDQILQELRELDYNYKNGLIDLEVGLESILCNYCSK